MYARRSPAPRRAAGSGRGAAFRIVETFRADPRFAIDRCETVCETVCELGPPAITRKGRIARLGVTRLAHRFAARDGAAGDASCLAVGFAVPVPGRVLNRLVVARRFRPEMGRARIARNIEEVGQLDACLPALWAPRAGA